MNEDLFARGLAKGSQTKVINVGRGVAASAGKSLSEVLGVDKPFLVVADEHTWKAAGAAVCRSLQEYGQVAEPMIYPGYPALYASYDHCEEIKARLAKTGATGVAVGSGTINDLVKLASGELGQPYGVVGTAASMDGYSGFGAPMGVGGVKVTLPCPAPAVVVFDYDVAAAAPRSMTASGFGDLSAKLPGGADWILADAVGVEPIDPLAWELVQSGVQEALSQPAALAAGDPDAYEGLVNGLLLSGLSMQVYEGTRPASGAEHYFSHLWELDHLGADLEPPLSHGFKVAIGTLAMTAFYERFLERDFSALDIEAAVRAWPSWEELEADIRSKMDGPLAEKGVKETAEKYVGAEGLRARLGSVAGNWPALAKRLRAQLLPFAELQERLGLAGAPTKPEDIGLSALDVKATFPKAMYYRSRYTVLDLAREAGWFDSLVDEVFEGSYWA
ncbi:MAG: sn-glycerol-1-phosphate dehydrogenase [Propionibacteriaceae bacterium]|jgi:glycerol-1-phosphate dehydrogenase [NAD(P)+]|nr:sn-glycerol-1-phosphate dehydrogenase [Propionibacteriaceae bacterium]